MCLFLYNSNNSYEIWNKKRNRKYLAFLKWKGIKFRKFIFLNKLEPTKSGYSKPEKVNIVIIDKVKR